MPPQEVVRREETHRVPRPDAVVPSVEVRQTKGVQKLVIQRIGRRTTVEHHSTEHNAIPELGPVCPNPAPRRCEEWSADALSPSPGSNDEDRLKLGEVDGGIRSGDRVGKDIRVMDRLRQWRIRRGRTRQAEPGRDRRHRDAEAPVGDLVEPRDMGSEARPQRAGVDAGSVGKVDEDHHSIGSAPRRHPIRRERSFAEAERPLVRREHERAALSRAGRQRWDGARGRCLQRTQACMLLLHECRASLGISNLLEVGAACRGHALLEPLQSGFTGGLLFRGAGSGGRRDPRLC